MAEQPTIFISNYTGTEIDNAIKQTGENKQSIDAIGRQIEEISANKADKSQIPTSISDLIQDDALIWIGDKAPENPIYTIWVYLSNETKTSKIYTKSKDGMWIDTCPETFEIFEVRFHIEEFEGEIVVNCAVEISDIIRAMDKGQFPIGSDMFSHKTFLLQSISSDCALFSCTSKDEDDNTVIENIEYTTEQGWAYRTTPLSSEFVITFEGGLSDFITGETISLGVATATYEEIRQARSEGKLPVVNYGVRMPFIKEDHEGLHFGCIHRNVSYSMICRDPDKWSDEWSYEEVALATTNGSEGTQEIYVGSGEMPEGYVLQIDPEGEGFDSPQENTVIVTLRNNGGIITSDKTFDEMYEMTQLGVNIVAQLGEVFYRLAIVEPAILWFSMSYSVSSEGCIWTLTCNKLDDVNYTWSLQKTDLPTKEYVDNAIANTGGGSGGVSTLHVTITNEGGKYTSDYTIDEMYEAYMSGRPVVVHLGSDIYQPMSSGTMPTTMVFMTSSYHPLSPSIKYIHMNSVPGTNDTAIEVLTLPLMSMAEINDNFESLSSNINNSKPIVVQVHSYDAGDGAEAYAASHSFTDLQMAYRNGQFIVVIYQDKVYQLAKYTPGVEFMFSHFNSETNCVEKFGCLPNGWMPTNDIELATKDDIETYIDDAILGGAW